MSMSALATVTQKIFNGKFAAKIWFSDRAFYATFADADIVSLKSRHTFFDEYLNLIMDEVVTPFLKTFPWLKQLLMLNYW